MKKTISIFIALALCLSFSTIALAATDITTTETPATTVVTTTTAPVTTIPATTAETTASDTTAAAVETSADASETTAADTAESEADTTMDPIIYYNAVPDDLKRDILTVPQTGSAAGGIAIFAVLSIAAAAAFICKKNKA